MYEKFRTEGLVPFNPKIERTCRESIKEKGESSISNNMTHNNKNQGNNNPNLNPIPDAKALRDYALHKSMRFFGEFDAR